MRKKYLPMTISNCWLGYATFIPDPIEALLWVFESFQLCLIINAL